MIGETDRGNLDLVLMGEAMLSKSLIQFSVDGKEQRDGAKIKTIPSCGCDW